MNIVTILLPFILVVLGLKLGLKIAKVEEVKQKWGTVIFDAIASSIVAGFIGNLAIRLLEINHEIGILALRLILLFGVLYYLLSKNKGLSKKAVFTTIGITFIFWVIAIIASAFIAATF